jgi:hypothetical protein
VSRRSSRLPWLDRLDLRIERVVAWQYRSAALAIVALLVSLLALARTCGGLH